MPAFPKAPALIAAATAEHSEAWMIHHADEEEAGPSLCAIC